MMDQVISHDFEDWPDWPLRNSHCVTYGSQDSETASLLSSSQFPPPPSPTVTSSSSDKGKAPQSPPGEVLRLHLNPCVTMYVGRLKKRKKEKSPLAGPRSDW